jgi:hypothetical protein
MSGRAQSARDETIGDDVTSNSLDQKAIDGRARRAAARVGLIAKKSRRGGGGFMLYSYDRGCIDGSWHDLSAERVIEICRAFDPKYGYPTLLTDAAWPWIGGGR